MSSASPFILLIESSARICSVALAKGGEVIGLLESDTGRAHASLLTPFIDQLLLSQNLKPGNLSAVAVSLGPGSYTGLRIGVSVAKGLCYGLGIPFIGLSTLQTLCYQYLERFSSPHDTTWLCPLVDARRMEVFTCFFDHSGEPLSEISAQIIGPDSFAAVLEQRKLIFFGDGTLKCSELLRHPNAILIEDIEPRASFMLQPALKAWEQSDFRNTAYVEPFYLKDFVATTPRKQLEILMR